VAVAAAAGWTSCNLPIIFLGELVGPSKVRIVLKAIDGSTVQIVLQKASVK